MIIVVRFLRPHLLPVAILLFFAFSAARRLAEGGEGGAWATVFVTGVVVLLTLDWLEELEGSR